MRAPFAVLALLLAGCGDDAPSWSAFFEGAPTVSVTAWRGTVRLRNSTNGKVEISVRGARPAPPERPWVRTDERRSVALVVPESAKDRDLEIDVAAPPGASVTCACAEAAIEVSGTWARVGAKTSGAITARVERADSGEIESLGGAVVYEAATGPTGELFARAARGDVTIRLPASWNGQVDCATVGGKLDVAPHKNLQTIRDEDGKHVVGRVGPRGGDKALPTVWGSSAHGNVSLRLEE